MRRTVILFAVVLLTGLAASAFAQTINDEMKVNIPYSFTIHGKQFPAGNYIIRRASGPLPLLIIRDEKNTKGAEMEVLTRIDGRSELVNDARIVLDKFDGDRYALSEVYFPGEDGYLIAGAKNTVHKHETIKASPKTGADQ